jgi:hypothetical protein
MFLSPGEGSGTSTLLGTEERVKFNLLDWVIEVSSFWGTQHSRCLSYLTLGRKQIQLPKRCCF